MPGHKRNIKFCIPSSNIDITEISGFDNQAKWIGGLLNQIIVIELLAALIVLNFSSY